MGEKMPCIRAFIAIPLPYDIKHQLRALQGQLRTSGTGIKASWVNPDAMHLTLKFLGDIKLSQIDAIKICMEKAVKNISPPALYASGLGGFPSVHKARVIWTGIDGQTEVIEKLASRLENLLGELGFSKEKRRYFPHLTLVRVKRPVFSKQMTALRDQFGKFRSKPFFVSDLILYKSELKSSGAVHKKIYSIPL